MSRLRASQIRRPSDLAAWWCDAPMRSRWWWREVLFAPGEGWLRWSTDVHEHISYEPPDQEFETVYPPLRRAWLHLASIASHPYYVLRGDLGWSEFVRLDEYPQASADRKALWQ